MPIAVMTGCNSGIAHAMAKIALEDGWKVYALDIVLGDKLKSLEEKQFTYGPFLLTQALLPNILAAPEPRRLSVVSSRVGSIVDNTSGGYYAYRASKTAVNSFFKPLSVGLKDKGVIVTVLHPGFTKTNLEPDIWKMPGVVEPEVAAGGLWKMVLEKGIEETGKFWHRDNFELPW
ncbi:uncharacterized protein MYCFIDRAFT_63608 [Pseudocercospora fijiensis CIRAD86]|uniref:Uncharacterized protein n=1 Tax=Pseudocercospora fijiensis (strain CIRAD86) TaxID=383855 RepID=N1QBR6_PSEFD|nr:uncharacterized protein MYCFIDRAFT_63608 [Pseudocercospora fijiensis CIRAD86]EME89631.1 hypothetical protein MYCFIDRAFT_63608 [Pseudocercospora fijiensis CIRAD86]